MDRISGSALLDPGPGKAGLPGQWPEGAWGPGRSRGIWGCPGGSGGLWAGSGRAPLREAAPCRPLLLAQSGGNRQAGKGAKERTEKGERGGRPGYFTLWLRPVLISLPSLCRKIPLEEKKGLRLSVFSPCPVPTPAAAPGLFAPPACPDGAYRGGAAVARVLGPCRAHKEFKPSRH